MADIKMHEDEGFVSGDGWLSDDSDFYGTPQQQKQLEKAINKRDLSAYDRYKHLLPYNIAYEANHQDAVHLHNPFEGQNDSARQLGETASDFVKRLRPSEQTESLLSDPWIWVANPHSSRPTIEQDTAKLVDEGIAAIDDFREFKGQTEAVNHGKSKAVITKKLTPKRLELEEHLKSLALKCHVTSGKWMLFPSVKEVDRTWRIVAEAVIDGRLGSTAKVARGAQDSDSRLICVYTDDFSDVDDVRRVLDGLVDLGLVKSTDTKGLWYKADVYTYLDIDSKNDLGMKASLYSSREMLK